MATYLPGVVDYIPEIQPFRPDYNFYSGALQMKQGQYDAAHKQLSNLYGSLLNAPMLRDQNIDARDQFFKAIDNDIHKISGLDLSLQENVSAASNLFTQIYDNQNIVKDMVWTKNYQSELTRAENFRNCVDVEKCGGAYWDDGVKALNYKADEFRKATDQDALGMQNVKFASYQNVMEKAIKAAKDADLNIEIDQVNGRYIYTTKNGPQLVRPLSELFTGLFGEDPAIKDYYKTKAYVQRKDWVMGNAGQYGGEAGAEQAYADQITKGMEAMFGQMEKDVEFHKNNMEGQKKNYEDRIRKNGTIPNSPLARQYQELNQYGEQLDASGEVIKTTNGYIKNTKDPALRRNIGANVDNAVASLLLQGDITSAAQTLAFKDYSVKMEADPYALENVKQANRLALEETKFKYNMALEKYKMDPEAFEKQQQAKGDADENIPVTKNDVVGGAAVNLEDDGAAVVYEDMVTEQRKDFSASERIVLDEFIKRTQEHSKNPQGENGKGIASDDLVALADAMISEINTQDEYGTFERGPASSTKDLRAKGGKKIKADWDAMSYDQKVEYAQNFKFSDYLTADYATGLSGTAVDNIYDTHVKKLIPEDRDQYMQREYLRDWYLGTASQENRQIIEHKEATLNNLNEWFVNENKNILSEMKSQPEFAEYGNYMDYYFDENFRPRSAREFANEYLDAHPDEAAADPEAFSKLMKVYYGGDIVDGQLEESSGGGHVYSWMDPEVVNQSNTYGGYIFKGPNQMQASMIRDSILEQPVESQAALWKQMMEEYPDLELIPVDADGNELGGVFSQTKSGSSLEKAWRNAFSKFANPDGGAMYLGLMGNDSYAARGLNFSRVDPVSYQSSGTLNTMSFFKDVMGANTGDALITLGGPQMDMEEIENNAELMPIFNQIYQDMYNRADPKDKKRPILNVTYQNIAGGNRDWTALNIKFNDPYMAQYLGSEDNPGLFRSTQGDLRTDGMTIYLKKDGAQNGFVQGTSKTSLEHDLYWTGQHNINAYPDVMQNVRLVSNDAGGFDVLGEVYSGLNPNGTVKWTGLQQYYPPGITPDDIRDRLINGLGASIQPAYDDEMSVYTAQHPDFTTDPSQL